MKGKVQHVTYPWLGAEICRSLQDSWPQATDIPGLLTSPVLGLWQSSQQLRMAAGPGN